MRFTQIVGKEVLTFLPYTLSMVIPLTNQNYYGEIITEMHDGQKAGRQPTVLDMVETMRKKGNREYYLNNPEIMSVNAIETPLKQGALIHEICHLCPKLGHTPLQEVIMMHFMLGLTHHDGRMEDFDKLYSRQFHAYKNQVAQYANPGTEEKWGNVSKRDKSIYFAAGLYLKQKIAAYNEKYSALNHYEQREEFVTAYSKPTKEAPTRGKIFDMDQNIIAEAPWQLIQLSRTEWQAITAVATGLSDPQRTNYPERMKEIKHILHETNLFYDLHASANKSTGSSSAKTR
ncbi:MAG: hypothetical protein P8P30_07195 [Rickettsiales bacterium]|nr:hypothetical protein [Rickettsiales bacterium]